MAGKTRTGTAERENALDPAAMRMREAEERLSILTELEAKEAAMNGATVRYRRSAPYLRCPLCGGDGTAERPRLMGCDCPSDPGWEIVSGGDGR